MQENRDNFRYCNRERYREIGNVKGNPLIVLLKMILHSTFCEVIGFIIVELLAVMMNCLEGSDS